MTTPWATPGPTTARPQHRCPRRPARQSRFGASMAYDPMLGQLVLVCGSGHYVGQRGRRRCPSGRDVDVPDRGHRLPHGRRRRRGIRLRGTVQRVDAAVCELNATDRGDGIGARQAIATRWWPPTAGCSVCGPGAPRSSVRCVGHRLPRPLAGENGTPIRPPAATRSRPPIAACSAFHAISCFASTRVVTANTTHRARSRPRRVGNRYSLRSEGRRNLQLRIRSRLPEIRCVLRTALNQPVVRRHGRRSRHRRLPARGRRPRRVRASMPRSSRRPEIYSSTNPSCA